MNHNSFRPNWSARPADEKFTDLSTLETACREKFESSQSRVYSSSEIEVHNFEDKDLHASLPCGDTRFSHWSFQQFANLAQCPAEFLRKVCPELAAVNLNYGLRFMREPQESNFYMWPNGNADTPELRAVTGATYGRYPDFRCVQDVQEIAQGWSVPFDLSRRPNATTLYSADRDVWMFLVDASRPITVPRQEKPAYRGFIVRNSEVGAGSWSMQGFLYNSLCENRTIFGFSALENLRIRHTSGAPDRIRFEGKAILRDFAMSSADEVEQRLLRADNIKINKGNNASEWVRKQGFTKAQAEKVVVKATEEQGQCETAWDAIQGMTALARSITHADSRVARESVAGKVFERITG
ncbi:MAG: DUF932 domain-containing protein [bacterium]